MSEKKSTKQEQGVKQEEPVAGKQDVEQKDPTAGQQAEKKDAVIYLGPPIMGVAMPGTVYKNGLTPQLQKAVKEAPVLNRLLVATGNAQKVRKDLKDPQSAVSICYQGVLEYAKKKGAEG